MRGPTVRIALIAGAAFACAALLPIVAAPRPTGGADPGPREIRLVAREMAFFIEGQEAANPTLRFTPGERIRLVLRNDDPGLTHDFTIGSWNVATKTLSGKGTEAAVDFRVPNERGTTAYQCTPHSQMMRGSVRVE